MIALLLLSWALRVQSCAPSMPGGVPTTTLMPPTQPAKTTTVTPAPCCPIDIHDDDTDTGSAVFHPELRDCPRVAMFICSVKMSGNLDPTVITINSVTEVTVGRNGTNTELELICQFSESTWYYKHNGQNLPVVAIACDNEPFTMK